MEHIKDFQNFIYESQDSFDSSLNEKEVFITDDRFKDEKTLFADILKNMGPAINKLLKDKGINYNPITVSENRGRYQFDSKPVMGDALGIMKYGFKEVYIDTFGGGAVPRVNMTEAGMEFPPYIWFNLHYSYEHGSADTSATGSNGCAFYLPGERQSNIYYDIVKGEFYGSKEAEKRHRD
jgi:hypothetical protein